MEYAAELLKITDEQELDQFFILNSISPT